jgi:DNA-binding transcriptional LysR family regulator
MGDMAEIVFLPPLLGYMRLHAPGCTLTSRRIVNEDIVEALEGGAVDLALGIFPEVRSHIYQKTIFSHDYVVLAWNKHPRIKSRLTWAAYQREEHVVVASGSDRNLLRHTLEPLGIQRKVRLTLDGFLSVPWLVKGTDYLATVPTRLSEEIVAAASLKQFSLPQRAKPFRLQSMWHPRLNNDPGHRWLREAVFTLMNRYPDLG